MAAVEADGLVTAVVVVVGVGKGGGGGIVVLVVEVVVAAAHAEAGAAAVAVVVEKRPSKLGNRGGGLTRSGSDDDSCVECKHISIAYQHRGGGLTVEVVVTMTAV